MPAQSDVGNSVVSQAYVLRYKDGYCEYLYCENDSAAVNFARKTIRQNGFTDLQEVTRQVGNDIVRVWWSK